MACIRVHLPRRCKHDSMEVAATFLQRLHADRRAHQKKHGPDRQRRTAVGVCVWGGFDGGR